MAVKGKGVCDRLRLFGGFALASVCCLGGGAARATPFDINVITDTTVASFIDIGYVPEPNTALLVGVGLVGLGYEDEANSLRRKRRLG